MSGRSKKLFSITTCRTSLEATQTHASACMQVKLALKTTGPSLPAVASLTQTDTSLLEPRRRTMSSSARLSTWHTAEREKTGFLHLRSIEGQSIMEDCSVKLVSRNHRFLIERLTRKLKSNIFCNYHPMYLRYFLLKCPLSDEWF